MKKYLLIDGYNIINAWKDVFDMQDDLELNRIKLIEMLTDFQGNNDFRVIVVFDAQQVKGGKGSIEQVNGLLVIFTGENETADNYIERFVYENGSTDRVWVATSDYLEQTLVLSNGGARITPKELRKLLSDNKKEQKRIMDSTGNGRNFFMDFLTAEQKIIMEQFRRKNRG